VTAIRREPPAFRRVAVRRFERRSPRLMRVTLGGDELDSFPIPEPAASVRLLLPSRGTPELVIPRWNGNEFLLADGTRPVIRTFTPRRVGAGEIDIEIVLHGTGAASEWAESVATGRPAAVSGPGRGYEIPAATAFVLAGDETALPAISQLLPLLPASASVRTLVELADPAARLEMPAPVAWVEPPGDLFGALREESFDTGTRVWAAGEAAVMQRIRRHLFDERGVTRAQATIRGYWKLGRRGE